MIRYQDAVALEMSAPTAAFAPFTATVCQDARGWFEPIVVDSQGVPLTDLPYRYVLQASALMVAEMHRERLLLKFKRERGGENLERMG